MILKWGVGYTAALLVVASRYERETAMLRLREYRNADKDPGQWREIQTEDNLALPKQERARLKVRGIPRSKEDWFAKEFDGRVSLKVKRNEIDLDMEREKEKLIARCTFALLDCQNLAVTCGDEETATAYRKFFPEAVVGSDLVMDGAIAKNVELRELLLRTHTALLGEINEGINGLATAKAAEEEATAKN